MPKRKRAQDKGRESVGYEVLDEENGEWEEKNRGYEAQEEESGGYEAQEEESGGYEA